MSVIELPTAPASTGMLTMEDLVTCRPAPTELRRALWRLRGKAGFIVALGLTSYLGLVFVAHGLLLGLPLAAVLVIALVATGTSVMHDANHGAFGRSRGFNMTLAYSADVLGASSWLWRHKHNVLHHGNTNVVGLDTDIEQMPFARLAPGQPWRPWNRYQHLYIWLFYGMLTARWVFIADFASLVNRRVGSQLLPRRPRLRDLTVLFSGKALHIGWAFVLPFAFHRWWVVIAFYFACSWLVGFALAVIFQVAHCVDATEFSVPASPRRGDDFAAHQLRTTANVDCRTTLMGRPIAWLMGGLNHQIEHHLAPGLPHTSYPAMAERVQAACAAKGIQYRVHTSPWAALCSHTRWLREMGQPVAGDR
jgi:linoleoyl-CoA desaturase